MNSIFIKMKKVLFVIILLGGLFNCKNVLEKQPLTSITLSNFFQTGDDAESAIAGCYDAFQDDSYYGSSMNMMGETASDNVTSNNTDLAQMIRIQWTSLSVYPGRIYQFAYKGINRTNSVIKYVPAIVKGITALRKDQIMGEAYFIRAINYFNLVKCYGGVPLLLVPTESDATSSLERATEAAVYAQIEADLSQAENLLPASFGSQSLDRTRATKGAANLLQSRVYLYQFKYAQSAAAALKVINNSNYGVGLTTPFARLFPPKNQQENIFEIQFAGSADGGFTLPDLVLPAPPASYSFPKFNIPTDEFVNSIDKVNDLRFKKTGTDPGGENYTSLIYGGAGTGNDNGWFANKWRSTNFFSSKDNYCVFRLAEAYLNYAEAVNETNGPTQDALDKLNAIRTRAGLTAFTLADLPAKKDFRDALDRERRLEFAFEGERWFDLVRYARQAIADPSLVHKITALDIILQKRKTADKNYLLYPIPLNELNNNTSIVQNPGY